MDRLRRYMPGRPQIGNRYRSGGFQRGASVQKEENQTREIESEETKRGKRKVERDQKMRCGSCAGPSLGPVVWHVPHEPWIKVRLATSVEPLNFVFVSRIDGMDLGRMRSRWSRKEERRTVKEKTLWLIVESPTGHKLTPKGPSAVPDLRPRRILLMRHGGPQVHTRRSTLSFSAVADMKSERMTMVCINVVAPSPAVWPTGDSGTRYLATISRGSGVDLFGSGPAFNPLNTRVSRRTVADARWATPHKSSRKVT
jgi:hypothetical protein